MDSSHLANKGKARAFCSHAVGGQEPAAPPRPGREKKKNRMHLETPVSPSWASKKRVLRTNSSKKWNRPRNSFSGASQQPLQQPQQQPLQLHLRAGNANDTHIQTPPLENGPPCVFINTRTGERSLERPAVCRVC
jgi:hypothetical protein